MLLYARVAPTKATKRRSRAGCSFCKEKKKKCDESRPTCSRCSSLEQDCIYDAIKPRQRKKKETTNSNEDVELQDDIEAQDEYVDDISKITEAIDEEIDTSLVQTAEGLDWLETAIESRPLAVSWIEDVEYDGLEIPYEIGCSNFDSGDKFHQKIANIERDQQLLWPSLIETPYLELRIPAFSELSHLKSRRRLFDHFHNVLSHLIVLREEGSNNPFQQLVLPLSLQSSAVSGAIYALASAHLEFRGAAKEESSLLFHNEAVRSLSKLIDQGSTVDRNELLASVILLIYYEVLVQRGRSSVVDGHLRGAVAIMRRGPAIINPTSVFLERAFGFYDVIAALSLGTEPLSSLVEEGYTGYIENNAESQRLNSFGNGSFMPIDARGMYRLPGSADVLLGLATSLWPLIHRLSSLRGRKSCLERDISQGNICQKEAQKQRYQLLTDALEIELALESWTPPTIDEPSTDGADTCKDTNIGILHSALAYRHSALVHLYRSIHGVARDHDKVQQHTKTALAHCYTTAYSRGPMGALLWPLFVAACEAQPRENDRWLSQFAFERLEKRQGMANIGRAWAVVQEVWRRADAQENTSQKTIRDQILLRKDLISSDGDVSETSGADQDLWRLVSLEMGFNTLVFG